MVYNKYNSSGFDEESKMAWDLRKVFAIEVVGETLKQIALARKSGDYPTWYKLLKRDLATEIYKNLESDENKEIANKIKEVKDSISKNREAYTKKNACMNAEQHEALENALIELESLMYSKMQDNSMFGSKEDDEGL